MLVLFILVFLPLSVKFETLAIQMSRRSQIPKLTSYSGIIPSITHESVLRDNWSEANVTLWVLSPARGTRKTEFLGPVGGDKVRPGTFKTEE